MFISHKYRFIYFRTEKTASTSLVKSLLSTLDDSSAYFSGSKNSPDWARKLPLNTGTLQRMMPATFGLPMHASAAQIRRVLGAKVFDSYYKFSVDRNPWDRQISLYHHRRTENEVADLDFDKDMRSWVYRALHHTRLQNWDKYAIGDTIVADRVIQFENLAEELPKVLADIGVDTEINLGRHRANYRDKSVDYRTYYTDYTRDLIANWYAREIAAFSYTF